ncbi:hypothetical protein HYH03_006187 [Edaphochlamys debaryana]|uniref:Exostosin GT47 domain-containing protein n=1 Tax=Edaphochlamys debaryana TaxID=47281 RepID=A0A835Y322_9CHLO|nr:hypothetical protein HYH03_006187 [Edaphochlamys debaryana]|eukprot:KAG2495587.1 hypothetical protein HYH03_006187 [Edaphochlamys debaryana]
MLPPSGRVILLAELNLKDLALRCRGLAFSSVRKCTSSINWCINGCNGAGECIAGVCKCNPGTFGADCFLSLGPDGKPRLLADRGYTPRARGPRVYVYELPPEITTWRNAVGVDRPTARLFLERLTATGARVADGDTADWWFIPVTLRRAADAQDLAEALHYIRLTQPWFNRTQGHRHFVMAVTDLGRSEIDHPRTLGDLTQNITFVTYWGLTQDRPSAGIRPWTASHRNATDIVLPVFISPGKLRRMGAYSGRNHPKYDLKAPPAELERNGPTLYFAGRICGDMSDPRRDGVWPNCATPNNAGYSGGTRQLVHYHHWNRTGFLIKPTGIGGKNPLNATDLMYGTHMLTSKFCFGALGGGHAQRQIQAALAGCVPVLIEDNVLESFEPYLDWNEFGVRVAEADIPRLHRILAAVTPEEYGRKVSRLRCAAQHLAFSTVTGSTMGESGRFDAFETLLEVLRAKAEHPGVAPEGLRRADARLDAFMECRGEEEGEGDGSGLRVVERKDGASSAAGARAGQPQLLCSVSPFDAGDPDVRMCSKVFDLSFRPYGPSAGLMCEASTDLVACPRPWS